MTQYRYLPTANLIGINESYTDLVYFLMEAGIGKDHDWIHEDFAKFLTKLFATTVHDFLLTNEPTTFYTRPGDPVAINYRTSWNDRWLMGKSNIVFELMDSLNCTLEKDLGYDGSMCWDELIETMMHYSDLSNPNSPFIQFYHNMIELRDSALVPSYAISDVTSAFVADLTNRLRDDGYFGTNIKRYDNPVAIRNAMRNEQTNELLQFEETLLW